MKHNENRNVGILYEAISQSVLGKVADKKIVEASKTFSVFNRFFVKEDTEICKMNKIYSKLLTTEARNYYYASQFLKYLLKEAKETIDFSKLDADISKLCESISDFKSTVDQKIDNYKLFASFKCLLDDYRKVQRLTAEEKIKCESVLLERLLKNSSTKTEPQTNLTSEQTEELKLALVLAMNSFARNYGGVLSEEQKEFLYKYLSTTDRQFSKWSEKKLSSIMSEINRFKGKIIDENMNIKVNNVIKKLTLLRESKKIESQHFIDILLMFELKDTLKQL